MTRVARQCADAGASTPPNTVGAEAVRLERSSHVAQPVDVSAVCQEAAADLHVLAALPVRARRRPQEPTLAPFVQRERSDEELSRLGCTGVDALFRRHHAALYRFCLGLGILGEEAADVMQTVWERAFVTFSQRSGLVLKVRPWLYTVARNGCLDAIRARNKTDVLDVGELELTGGLSAEETFEQRAELALLLGDLAELSERQRSALVLRELAGFEGEELAGALGTSSPRAMGLVAEARRGLIERRSGRGLPCSTARQELTRMRRRSTGVQAHLDSCSDCQFFERGRRGRSLSSLAITPLVLLHRSALEAWGAVATSGAVAKPAIATLLVAGAIGTTDAVIKHDARPAPNSSETAPEKPLGARASTSPAHTPQRVHVIARRTGTTTRTRQGRPLLTTTPGPQKYARPPSTSSDAPAAPTRPAAPLTAPSRTPDQASGAKPQPAEAHPPDTSPPQLALTVETTVDQALLTAQSVGSTLNAAVATVRNLLSSPPLTAEP